jgi:hypothetical protein
MPVQVVAEDRSTEIVGSVYEGVQEKSICEVPPPPDLSQFATNLHNSPTGKQQRNCLCHSYHQNHQVYFHAVINLLLCRNFVISCVSTLCSVDRDSSVGIAIRYWLDGPGIESRWKRDLPHLSSPARGTPSVLYNRYRLSFPEVKRPGRGVNRPPPSTAEVKERLER